MRICILSDTHGELDNVKTLIEKLKSVNPDIIIHLGDDSPDAEPLKELNKPLYVVPGVFEEIYKKPETERRKIIEISGLKIMLSHTDTKHQNDPPDEKDPQELINKGEIDILLHGHTHIPKIELRGRKLIINPGHLKKQDKKGFPPTYAIMEINDNIYIKIIELFTDRIITEFKVDKKFLKP